MQRFTIAQTGAYQLRVAQEHKTAKVIKKQKFQRRCNPRDETFKKQGFDLMPQMSFDRLDNALS